MSPVRQEQQRADDTRIRAVVVFGGRDPDHDKLCASAASVIAGLDPRRYAVQIVRVTQDGEWVAGPDDLTDGVRQGGPLDAEALCRLTPSTGAGPLGCLERVLPLLSGVDVVFPLLQQRSAQFTTVIHGLRAARHAPAPGRVR
ncbi:hypothetical protein ACFP1Z_12810 [Streptomyces gamaensis]|uniref:D-alanine--D-alanine ligase N-terminal domain-containing protein n=1 Tax=Streptomyces gamaensis TaxID=1763542 RepID=A0ABW0YWU0_9ACTN